MKLVCPHCRAGEDYRPEDIHIFVRCPRCTKEFRPVESPVQIGGRSQPGRAVLPNPVFGGNPLAPSEPNSEWLKRSQRAGQLYRLRRYDDAEGELRESLRLNPDQPGARRLLRRIQALRSAR